MRSVRQPSHTDAAVESVNESEKGEGNCEQGEGEMICGGVVDGLYVVVDGDGDGSRGSWKIAADHEDDAELAEGVGKCEDNGGEHSGKGEREDDTPKRAPVVGAKDSGGGQEFWIESFEGGNE